MARSGAQVPERCQAKRSSWASTRDPLELFIDRRVSRATPFHEDYPGRHAGPVRWRDDRVALRVLFDRNGRSRSSPNDGETVMTDRVYPTQPFDRIELLHAPGEMARHGPDVGDAVDLAR